MVPRAAKANRYLNFNCLKQPCDTHTATLLTLETMRHTFPELGRNAGNAAALEQIVTTGTHVLVDKGLLFSELRRVPLGKTDRDRLLRQVTDPLIADDVHTEFDAYDNGERRHLVGSTLRWLCLLWRTQSWNGLQPAFQNSVLALLGLILIHLPSPQRAAVDQSQASTLLA